MKTKVGDYRWVQVSIWDFAPPKSIQKYPVIINPMTEKPYTLHYYLSVCTDIVTDTHSKWRAVLEGEDVPEEILNS